MGRPISRPFTGNPEAGIRRQFHWDPVTESFTIETVQEVTDLIDTNKRCFNTDHHTGRKWQGDMHRVASIPLSIYFQLKEQGIVDDPARMKQWLNDPANRAFRTKEGRV